MERLAKVMLNSIITIILMAVMVNILGIYSTHNSIKKVARVMIFYAQKNGGFVDAYDKNGNLLTDVNSFFNNLIIENELEEVIKSEFEQSGPRFNPAIGDRVSRKTVDNESSLGTELSSDRIDAFKIRLEAEYDVFLPFVEDYKVDLPVVEEMGFSQKYFKE